MRVGVAVEVGVAILTMDFPFVTRDTPSALVLKCPEKDLCHLFSEHEDIWWAALTNFLCCRRRGAVYGFLEEGLLPDSLCLPYSEKCSDFFLRRCMQDHSIASYAYVSV